ncbi:MAG: Xaa-Pro peptidase family protein [Muribaculaceae bacterium]|nr:Xaa-Pro peptidase family protein [Muribaculaceae bacterium]MDE6197808.1 Xaa-Pro peptidase family protein [Muribaculaceae bacterium]
MSEHEEKYNVNLLGSDEQALRLSRLKELMRRAGIVDAIVRDNADIYYLTGRVFRGYIYINVERDLPLYFVKQPNHLYSEPAELLYRIRKPEDIAPALAALGIETSMPALELDSISYTEASRLRKSFGATEAQPDISPVMRGARSVKTAAEQEMLRRSGAKQTLVYERIPQLYSEGMTDIELQIEIERASRLEGCLGQFRVAGPDMELFMGNVLTGDNADTPSPYDFAMGGEGLDPSIPVGANGTMIKPGMPVMVDVNGNYNGYMTDMTRMYIAGDIPAEAERANELSAAICEQLAAMMTPGAKAADLYARALQMASEAGMEEYFMGHRSHAGFVGHGVGIEVNEAPVIAPRSRDILADGNVIALEPKFVIPGLGAVGVENTYIVHADRAAEVITTARTAISLLD